METIASIISKYLKYISNSKVPFFLVFLGMPNILHASYGKFTWFFCLAINIFIFLFSRDEISNIKEYFVENCLILLLLLICGSSFFYFLDFGQFTALNDILSSLLNLTGNTIPTLDFLLANGMQVLFYYFIFLDTMFRMYIRINSHDDYSFTYIENAGLCLIWFFGFYCVSFL